MTTTFCNSGHVKLKAGANVSTALTDANYTTFINHAESFINDAVKIEGVDMVAGYAALPANVKSIFEDCASSKAAISAINFDVTTYTASECQTMLDINYTIFSDCMKLLAEKKVTDFIRSNPV